jgi:uncharacterized protein YqeY
VEDPRPQLQSALKEAMKTKDTLVRDVVRMAQNAIKQVEIDTRKDVSPTEAVEILQKEAKKRRESIADYEKAGRADMAQQEQDELALLERFLPKQMSADELRAIVDEVIAQVGVSSPKDIGRVMGPIMERVKGLADGKLVSQIVREQLNA